MNQAKRIAKLVHEYLMDLYPYFLCLSGGIFFAAGKELGSVGEWTGFFLAVFAWIFALDLARTRTRAKATSECASKFIGFMTNGDTSEINIFIHKQRD